MTKLYLLIIPITIGIIAGMFLAFYPESENNSEFLTASRLIENGSPIMGDSNAPITVLEWGDYQCTFCYKFHENTLDIINDDFIKTGKIKLVFKDFPLNGPDSLLAAEASYCAEDQEKYWKYHDELYKNWGGERTGWITRESLDRFAVTVVFAFGLFSQYNTKDMSLIISYKKQSKCKNNCQKCNCKDWNTGLGDINLS